MIYNNEYYLLFSQLEQILLILQETYTDLLLNDIKQISYDIDDECFITKIINTNNKEYILYMEKFFLTQHIYKHYGLKKEIKEYKFNNTQFKEKESDIVDTDIIDTDILDTDIIQINTFNNIEDQILNDINQIYKYESIKELIKNNTWITSDKCLLIECNNLLINRMSKSKLDNNKILGKVIDNYSNFCNLTINNETICYNDGESKHNDNKCYLIKKPIGIFYYCTHKDCMKIYPNGTLVKLFERPKYPLFEIVRAQNIATYYYEKNEDLFKVADKYKKNIFINKQTYWEETTKDIIAEYISNYFELITKPIIEIETLFLNYYKLEKINNNFIREQDKKIKKIDRISEKLTSDSYPKNIANLCLTKYLDLDFKISLIANNNILDNLDTEDKFIRDRLERCYGNKIKAEIFKKEYKKYCEENHLKPLHKYKDKFINEKKIDFVERSTGNFWLNIKFNEVNNKSSSDNED